MDEHSYRLPAGYKFAEADSPDNLLLGLPWQDSQSRDATVKAGTLSKLVERLTHLTWTDDRYTEAFLTTYKTFTNTSTFINLLIARFSIPLPLDISETESQKFVIKVQQPLQARVFHLLTQLVGNRRHRADFDSGVKAALQSFFNKAEVKEKFPNECMALGHLLNEPARRQFPQPLTSLITESAADRSKANPTSRRRKTAEALSMLSSLRKSISGSSHPSIPSSPTTPSHSIDAGVETTLDNILTVSPIDLASSLALCTHALLLAIDESELVACAWVSSTRPSQMSRMLSYLDSLQRVFIQHILQGETPNERADIIQHLIATAHACVHIRDFCDAAEIINALQSRPIARLGTTWHILSAPTLTQFAELVRLFSSDVDFGHYRGRINTDYKDSPSLMNAGYLPYVQGLTTLLISHLVVPENVTSNTQVIDFAKRYPIVFPLREMINAQYRPYQIPSPSRNVASYFHSFVDGPVASAEDDQALLGRSVSLEVRVLQAPAFPTLPPSIIQAPDVAPADDLLPSSPLNKRKSAASASPFKTTPLQKRPSMEKPKWTFNYPSSFPFADLDSSANVVKNEDDQLLGGTVPKIIEYLTSAIGSRDHDFLRSFLYAFRLFLTPEDLMSNLSMLFLKPDPTNATDDASLLRYHTEELVPLRLRIMNLMMTWISISPQDFQSKDPTFLDNLASFLFADDDLDSDALKKLTEDVKDVFIQAKASAYKFAILDNAPPPRYAEGKHETSLIKDVLSMDPHEAARQLALISMKLYLEIDLLGLTRGGSSKTSSVKGDMTNAFAKLDERQHVVSNWVAVSVVQAPNHKVRTEMLNAFIDVARESRDLGDLCTSVAIMLGLASPASKALHTAWHSVTPERMALLKDMSHAIRDHGSQVPPRINGPGVPYPKTAISAMVRATNLPVAKDYHGHLLYDRFSLIQIAAVLSVFRDQQQPYALKEVLRIREYLLNLPSMVEMDALTTEAEDAETGSGPNTPTSDVKTGGTNWRRPRQETGRRSKPSALSIPNEFDSLSFSTEASPMPSLTSTPTGTAAASMRKTSLIRVDDAAHEVPIVTTPVISRSVSSPNDISANPLSPRARGHLVGMSESPTERRRSISAMQRSNSIDVNLPPQLEEMPGSPPTTKNTASTETASVPSETDSPQALPRSTASPRHSGTEILQKLASPPRPTSSTAGQASHPASTIPSAPARTEAASAPVAQAAMSPEGEALIKLLESDPALVKRLRELLLGV